MISTALETAVFDHAQRRVVVLPNDHAGNALATWKQLDSEFPTPHVTASWPWVRAWIDAFGEELDTQFVLWMDGDRVDGCGLIVQSNHRRLGQVPIRTVHIGTTGEQEPGGVWAECNRPWMRRDHETAAFMEAMLAEAVRNPCHRFDIDGVEEPLLRAVGFPYDEVETRTSYVHDVSRISSRGDIKSGVLNQLGKSTRKNVKRRLNKYDGLRVEWTDTADEAFLDELIDLHQARWQGTGEPGAFAEPEFRQFVRGFVRLASGQDRYRLARVSDNNGTVGCQLLLREDGRVQDFVSGFASTDERPSPGLVCHFSNIVETVRQNLDGYEFLVGEARVKRDLSNKSRTICWAKRSRPTPRMRVLSAARGAVRIVKRVRAVTQKKAAR